MTIGGNVSEFFNEFNTTVGIIGLDVNASSSQGRQDAFGMFVKGLDLYMVPCVVFIGFVGNVTSFMIFTRTFLRFNSSSVYLSALALSDTGFLLCIFILWLHQLGLNPTGHNGTCQIFMYLIYVWSFLSVWYVVAFTTERFIAVCFPLKRNIVCSVKRAKILVVSLASFAAIYYSYGLWTSGITYNNDMAYCWPKGEYVGAVSVLNYIDTFLTLLLPVFVLIVFNTKIIIVVGQIKREQNKMRNPVSNGATRPPEGSRGRRSSHKHRRKPSPVQSTHGSCQIKVTKMLIIVSLTFLVLNLPNHTVRIYIDMCRLIKKQSLQPKRVHYAQMLFQHIYYINFGINIFLYAMFGSNFRKGAKSMFGNCKRKLNPYSWFCFKDTDSYGYSRKSTSSSSPTSLKHTAASCKTSIMSLTQIPGGSGRAAKNSYVHCEGTMV